MSICIYFVIKNNFWYRRASYQFNFTYHMSYFLSLVFCVVIRFIISIDMTIHDLPCVKKWAVKKVIFLDFGYFKGITGAIRNGNKRSCVYHDKGSQEQSYMQ
jgi:hypothetical protein